MHSLILLFVELITINLVSIWFAIGALFSAIVSIFTDSVLTPEDSLYIDRKIDDKVPTSGKVLAVSGDSVEDFFVRKPRRACAIENEYNVKNRKKACQLIINLN